MKLFTYIQQYRNINSSSIVHIKQDLTEETLLLDSLNNTQQAPVFLELDDVLFKFPQIRSNLFDEYMSSLAGSLNWYNVARKTYNIPHNEAALLNLTINQMQ